MKKIKTGIIWNIVSYAVLALLTLLLYVVLTRTYGKEELGAFNIIMSFYILSGHVGVWGLQSAAVFFVAQCEEEKKKVSELFSAALLIVMIMSSLVAVILSMASNFIGEVIYSSDNIAFGIRRIGPAIVLFSINKLILGYLNGFKEMKQYALLQALRYFIMVIFVIIVAVCGCEFGTTLYTFEVAEIGVLIIGSIYLRRYLKFRKLKRKAILKNFSFGSKAVLANVMEDFNTRIDVMMLGILASDRAVGLYSFISLIVEGVFKLLYIVRNNVNPIFAELFYKENKEDLQAMYKKLRSRIFFASILMGGILIIGYGIFCQLFLDAEYIYTTIALIIIFIGVVALAPFFVCGNINTQSGNPLQDTMVTFITIIANIGLNYILIQCWELYGAAGATAISYIVYAFFMWKLIKLKLDN